MKKITLTLLFTLLSLNIVNALKIDNKQDKLVKIFKEKIEKLDKYKLENIDLKIENIFKKYKKTDSNILFVNKIRSELKKEINKKGEVVYLDHDFILDFSDLTNVVGFADNVFIAKVLENKGQNENFGDIETNFKVEVLYNIKGKLKGNINTIFQGGFENGKLYVSKGDKMLEVGNTYLFVTMGDMHKISAHQNGNHLISKKEIKEEIKNEIRENKIIKDYIKAYKNEKDYKTKNKYLDLTKEEKEYLKDFENGFTK